MRYVRALAIAIIASAAVGGCGSETDLTYESVAANGPVRGSDSSAGQSQTDVVAVIAHRDGFNTLSVAIDSTELEATLSSNGPYTLFAPTDAAFDRTATELGITTDELIADTDLMTRVLTYHIVQGQIGSDLISAMNGVQLPTVNGEPVEVGSHAGALTINGAAIDRSDIDADNGIIHPIDSVLVPPSIRDRETLNPTATDDYSPSTSIFTEIDPPTVSRDGDDINGDDINGDTLNTTGTTGTTGVGEGSDDVGRSNTVGNVVEIVYNTPNLSMMLQALIDSDLYSTLANEGRFTLFAPTDEAFAEMLDLLGITEDELFADRALLAEIVAYHIMFGEHRATDLATHDGGTLETITLKQLAVALDGETIYVDNATVMQPDIAASNGVVHVIDAVMLPQNR